MCERALAANGWQIVIRSWRPLDQTLLNEEHHHHGDVTINCGSILHQVLQATCSKPDSTIR